MHGAAGGVGMAAVQLAHDGRRARDRHGARSRTRASTISALGVNALEPEGFEDHGPFDVMLELVGAPNLPGDLAALAERGRICVIGVGAGAKAELNLRALMGKRARIHGSVLRARSLEDKADAARRVERAVLPGFASGDLSVPVTATFPLDAVADAYARFRRARSSARSCSSSSSGGAGSSSASGSSAVASAAWTVHNAGPPASIACLSSDSVSFAPHSSQCSPTVSSVRSSRSMSRV